MERSFFNGENFEASLTITLFATISQLNMNENALGKIATLLKAPKEYIFNTHSANTAVLKKTETF